MAIVDWQDAGLHTGVFEHQSSYGVARRARFVVHTHQHSSLANDGLLAVASFAPAPLATLLGHKAVHNFYDV